MPPWPWTRWDETGGERIGWTVAWRLWKSYLLPYRTYELYFTADGDYELGPCEWRKPVILWRR